MLKKNYCVPRIGYGSSSKRVTGNYWRFRRVFGIFDVLSNTMEDNSLLTRLKYVQSVCLISDRSMSYTKLFQHVNRFKIYFPKNPHRYKTNDIALNLKIAQFLKMHFEIVRYLNLYSASMTVYHFFYFLCITTAWHYLVPDQKQTTNGVRPFACFGHSSF